MSRSPLLGSLPAPVRLNALALIIVFADFSDGLLAKAVQFDRQVQATFHRFNRNASDKVKLVSLSHRFMIALHSPDGVVQTVLLLCPSERKATNLRLVLRRSLSPVRFERKGLQNCGHFSRFSERGRLISLQPRLSGGESEIRTLVRVSPNVQADMFAIVTRRSAW